MKRGRRRPVPDCASWQQASHSVSNCLSLPYPRVAPISVAQDLQNEPHSSSWGKGLPTDWNKAAEKLGDHVNSKCARWMIFVEGVGYTPGAPGADDPGAGFWWGENLVGAKVAPVRLRNQSKLVYAPHVYGPAVYMQSYFKVFGFPNNMPAIWQSHFAFAQAATGTPIVIGEMGGSYVGADRVFLDWAIPYVARQGFGLFYFALNPNSKDTGGLLPPDWSEPLPDSVHAAKLKALEALPSTDVFKLCPACRPANQQVEATSKSPPSQLADAPSQFQPGQHLSAPPPAHQHPYPSPPPAVTTHSPSAATHALPAAAMATNTLRSHALPPPPPADAARTVSLGGAGTTPDSPWSSWAAPIALVLIVLVLWEYRKKRARGASFSRVAAGDELTRASERDDEGARRAAQDAVPERAPNVQRREATSREAAQAPKRSQSSSSKPAALILHVHRGDQGLLDEHPRWIGQRVRLHSLTQGASHNGTEGTIVGHTRQTDGLRYHISCDSGARLCAKPGNLLTLVCHEHDRQGKSASRVEPRSCQQAVYSI